MVILQLTGVYRDENGYAVEKIINESLSSSIGYDGISGIYSFNYGDNIGKKIESVNSKYQNIELKKEDDSHITLIIGKKEITLTASTAQYMGNMYFDENNDYMLTDYGNGSVQLIKDWTTTLHYIRTSV